MKEWWEREASYWDRYRQGKICTDIWKYIPKKVLAGVDSVAVDLDGYWIWLAPSWFAYDGGEDCGVIHEYTISGLIEAIKTIRHKVK